MFSPEQAQNEVRLAMSAAEYGDQKAFYSAAHRLSDMVESDEFQSFMKPYIQQVLHRPTRLRDMGRENVSYVMEIGARLPQALLPFEHYLFMITTSEIDDPETREKLLALEDAFDVMKLTAEAIDASFVE